MNFVGKGFKALTACAGGEFVGAGQKPTVFVHFHLTKGNVLKFIPHGGGVVGVPLNIHHHIFPAVGFQVLCHVFGIGQNIGFGHIGVVIVIAVPATGRLTKKTVHGLFSFLCFFGTAQHMVQLVGYQLFHGGTGRF